MTTYFTADMHLGHKNMTREGRDLCGRPFDTVEKMNEGLILGFNEILTRDDRLVILGDICMGKLENSLTWLSYLDAGEIVLIPGNHDRWSLAYPHRGTDEDQIEKRETFRQQYEMDERFWVIPDRENSYWTGATLGYEGEHPLRYTFFSHYPYDGDSHGDGNDRYGHLRAPSRLAEIPMVHGHVHTEWQVRDRQFNVGVDVNDFKPVSEEVLTEWVSSMTWTQP